MNEDAKILLEGAPCVPKVEESREVVSPEGLVCCVVRTYSAGVFYGYVKSRSGTEVELINAKRIWAWFGAASLSQLAVDGVSRPKECRIPCAVPSIILTQAIEIIPMSEKAFRSLESVPLWTA